MLFKLNILTSRPLKCLKRMVNSLKKLFIFNLRLKDTEIKSLITLSSFGLRKKVETKFKSFLEKFFDFIRPTKKYG